MLDRRMQLLLDEARYQRVAREAQRRGVPMAVVIRQAIDCLPIDDDIRRAAIDAVLGAATMPLPNDPSELRQELDRAHDRISG